MLLFNYGAKPQPSLHFLSEASGLVTLHDKHAALIGSFLIVLSTPLFPTAKATVNAGSILNGRIVSTSLVGYRVLGEAHHYTVHTSIPTLYIRDFRKVASAGFISHGTTSPHPSPGRLPDPDGWWRPASPERGDPVTRRVGKRPVQACTQPFGAVCCQPNLIPPPRAK